MRPVAVLLLFCSCLNTGNAAVARADIDFPHVIEVARRRAAEPHRPPAHPLPARFAELTYDDYRKVHFREDAALWRGTKLPFQVHFFPRGGLFKERVVLHEFSSTHVQEIPFNASWYEVRDIEGVRSLPRDLGYAGFRVLHPLNRRDAFDELISFLGASYFRAVGPAQQYGLSARGLALDSAIDGKSEEFPRFSEFWLGRPEANASRLMVYALLEGPSVTGAYEFGVTPGPATTVDVRAFLFFRTGDKLVGLAPLTSMFWYGENTSRPETEKRPEVHDSDGLLVDLGGPESIWRPLRNPPALEAVEIPAARPVRFGLLQRDVDPQNYADAEAKYERRPSAWIEPGKDWRPGKVRLAQLPTKDEYADNVVAYWVPDAAPPAGGTMEIKYRIVWSLPESAGDARARVIATQQESRRRGAPGAVFRVTFKPETTEALGSEKPVVDIEVGRGARVVAKALRPDKAQAAWTAEFEVEPMGSGPVELRCRLRNSVGALSETWLYTWNP